MDISGQQSEVNIRTDANNLVTTASTTHLPEQKETIHMIQMLRQEACSGALDDLAHVVSADCLGDALTKLSAKPDALIEACKSGVLPNCDTHPRFRDLMKHKAFLVPWIAEHLSRPRNIVSFLSENVSWFVAAHLSRLASNSVTYTGCPDDT